MRYGSIGGLEYEVPQSRLYCLCINVALCLTALQCICRVIRRSSMTMKAHTYYIIFGRLPIGGEASPFPPPGGTTGSVQTAAPIWLVFAWEMSKASFNVRPHVASPRSFTVFYRNRGISGNKDINFSPELCPKLCTWTISPLHVERVY